MKKMLLLGLILAACAPQNPTQETSKNTATGDEQNPTSTDSEDVQASDEVDDSEEEPVENLDEEPEEEQEEEPEEEQEETVVGFQPATGVWVVESSQLLEDGCSLSDSINRGEPGSTMDLTMPESTGFALTFGGGGETSHCELTSDNEYECDPTYSDDSTAQDMGMNANIPVEMITHGNFFSAEEMSMVTSVDIDCDGQDCFWIEILLGTTFPCTMVMSSDLNLQP